MEKAKIIKNGNMNLECLTVPGKPLDYMQTIINDHIQKLITWQENVVKDSLEKHFGIPLTKENYERVRIIQYLLTEFKVTFNYWSPLLKKTSSE